MDNLTYKLAHIGFQLADKNISLEADEFIDIEQTIIDACYAAWDDGRLLSVLFAWANIHGQYLIAEKLGKIYKENSKYRGEAPLFYGLCAFLAANKQHKFKKFVKSLPKKQSPKWVIPSAIKMKGAVSYLEKVNIIMPDGSIRIRQSDVLSIAQLVKVNQQYHNRLKFGANVRADIVTAIEVKLGNPHQISKHLYCSYESARRIVREYDLLI